MTLTRPRLMELLSYNPETGIFRWKINGRLKRVGRRAGSISGGYRRITLDGRQYRASHLAWLYMNGVLPVSRLDHRDRNSLNDRIGNLRLCTHAQNMANRTAFRTSKTGVKGVYPSRRRWIAIISANHVRHYLGSFPSMDAAQSAYARVAEKLHGDFATA